MHLRLFNAAVVTNMEIASKRFTSCTEVERKMRLRNPNYLESYHYVGKPVMVKRLRHERALYHELTGEFIKFFLDSGAFSAYNIGAEIDLGRYCDYCLENQDLFEVVSVLDKIDFNNTRASAKGTYWNLQEMEKRGVKALPCFHFGEPMEVLEHYVANYEYITIGGMVPISNKQLFIWLDNLWGNYLTNADGTAKVKVHGFGLTSLIMMIRYPWYSVDSSAWIQTAIAGKILMPEASQELGIGSRIAKRKMQDQHIDTLPEITRNRLEAEIIKYGGDPQRLRDLYYARWAWNIMALLQYVELKGGGATTFKAAHDGLFDR